MIGPFRGGRTVAAGGVPGNTNVFYIGVNNGGVWKTTDDGRTWTPIFDDQPTQLDRRHRRRARPIRHVSTSAAARACSGPISPSATASTSRRTRARPGRTSACATAQQIPAHRRRPARPGARLRGGPRPSVRPERRARRLPLDGRRRDAGRRCSTRTRTPAPSDVALDPADPQIVYAVLWAARQAPWENGELVRGRGAASSSRTDGGTTWKQLTKGLPTFGARASGASASASRRRDPERLYASVDATPRTAALYRSDDAGESWRRVNGTRRASGGAAATSPRCACDPKNPDVVYVANTVDVPLDRRRQDVHRRQGRAGRRRLPPHLDQSRRTPTIILLGERSGRDDHGERRARPGAPGTTSRRRSSTTSPPTTAFPTGSTAGSRRAARPAIASRGDDGAITLPRLASRRRRGVRLRRARSARPRPHLRRQGHALRPAPPAQVQDVSPEPLRRGEVPLRAHRCRSSSRPADPHVLFFAGERRSSRPRDGGQTLDGDQPGPDARDAGGAGDASASSRAGRSRARRAPRRHLRRRALAAGREP